MKPEWFKEFAEDLVVQKAANVGDDDLTDDIKAIMVKDVSVRTRDYVLKHLLESLNEEELTKIETALASNDEASAKKIMDGKQNEVAQALGSFRSKYLGVA